MSEKQELINKMSDPARAGFAPIAWLGLGRRTTLQCCQNSFGICDGGCVGIVNRVSARRAPNMFYFPPCSSVEGA